MSTLGYFVVPLVDFVFSRYKIRRILVGHSDNFGIFPIFVAGANLEKNFEPPQQNLETFSQF